MNVRKPADFSGLFAALNELLQTDLPQTELYYHIGQLICERPEKGAAVAAAGFLHERAPDMAGFSPRNVRRMRDFYRTYKNEPTLIAEAMKVGWTQNTVILESELTQEQRLWYLRAVRSYGWSKAELVKQIALNAYEQNIKSGNENPAAVKGQPVVPDDECSDGKASSVSSPRQRIRFGCRFKGLRHYTWLSIGRSFCGSKTLFILNSG